MTQVLDAEQEGVAVAPEEKPREEGQFCILIVMVVTQIYTGHMILLHRTTHTYMHTYTHACETGKFRTKSMVCTNVNF